MKLYKHYAIITLDDDIGYVNDTFETLFNAYVENPNIISGRRGHLITYKKNGEIKFYKKWIFEQKKIKYPDFRITLTNGAGSIFPPDILNMNEEFLSIINETITCDDLTLKYFSVLKGIPHKWIINNHVMGIPRALPKSKSVPLFKINKVNNDICINKLNILINKTYLKNLCINYKNISTGNTIYLFDFHNQHLINDKLYFDIYAYSFCPIDSKFKFNIYFENYTANCLLNNSMTLNHCINDKILYRRIISCYMSFYAPNYPLNNYYFPKVINKDNLIINIYNYRTYLTAIFKEFFCKELNTCILKIVLYEKSKFNNFIFKINNNQYFCQINENLSVSKYLFPVIKEFNCSYTDSFYESKNIFISGLKSNINILNKTNNNVDFPKQFIIDRIVINNEKLNKNIVIIGNMIDHLANDIYYFSVFFFFPNITLQCYLKPFSKYVKSQICCINDKNVHSTGILIENQIVHTFKDDIEIILINKETLLRLNLS